MINDVEHIFVLICYPPTFFDELSVQSFAYFKKLGCFCFLIVEFWEVFLIKSVYKCFIRCMNRKYFHPICDLCLHSIDSVFWRAAIYNFEEV